MTINAMYLPKERHALIKGFVCNKNGDAITIAVVDPGMDVVPNGAEIKDVQFVALSSNDPSNNERFFKCLAYAKRTMGDAEWDAIRKESVQRFKLGTLIPDSKYFKTRGL